MEEVWRLIQGQDHAEGTSLSTLRVGELLDMAGAQLGPSHVPSASRALNPLEGFQNRRLEGLHPNLPPFNNMSSLLLHGTGEPTARVAIPSRDPPRPDKNAAAAARAARQKKRKERSALSNETNEEEQKAKQRLVKNRESAARSRQRFKKYTEELEAEVHRLKLELAVLRQSIQEKGEEENGSWILASRRLPLRRTRTLKY